MSFNTLNILLTVILKLLTTPTFSFPVSQLLTPFYSFFNIYILSFLHAQQFFKVITDSSIGKLCRKNLRPLLISPSSRGSWVFCLFVILFLFLSADTMVGEDNPNLIGMDLIWNWISVWGHGWYNLNQHHSWHLVHECSHRNLEMYIQGLLLGGP